MRKWILGLAFLVSSALPGWSQTPEEMIIASLEEQGYHVVTRDRTWLGRIWLLVENGEIRREIVFNPGTGEIMRDYAVMIAAIEREMDRSTKGSATTVTKAADPATGAVDPADPLATTATETAAPTVTDPALIVVPQAR